MCTKTKRAGFLERFTELKQNFFSGFAGWYAKLTLETS